MKRLPVHSNDPNGPRLEAIASHLTEDLLERFVFVGGAVTGLLITDPAMPPVRTTLDVDVVVEVLATRDYHDIEDQLRRLGFSHDLSPTAPICRWIKAGLILDVMPTRGDILGFTNPWYSMAVEHAEVWVSSQGRCIRIVQAPVFLATKLEAFRGRGQGDFLCSHDLGDVLAVVDGRDTLIQECQHASFALRHYLGVQFTELLGHPAFCEALPCHLPGDAASQQRLPDLQRKLAQLAALSEASDTSSPPSEVP
jgi:predicted nucleotidyltransferase